MVKTRRAVPVSIASLLPCLLCALSVACMGRADSPTNSISGSVTMYGRPVQAASVALTHESYGGVGNVSTDANGVYTFSDVREGEYTLAFAKAGYTFDNPLVRITVGGGGVTLPENVSVISWKNAYGGSGDEQAYAVRPTPDYGCVVAGFTGTGSSGVSDVLVKKLDLFGVQEWSYASGGPGYDVAYDIERTLDGGYIVVGEYENGLNINDFYILKLSGGGEKEWERLYGFSERDVARSVRQTSDGGYIIVGSRESDTPNRDLDNYYILKLDTNGNLGDPGTWRKEYGGESWDVAYAVEETGESYVIAGSAQIDLLDPSRSAILVRWLRKSDGEDIYNKTYSLGDSSEARAMVKTPDNGFVIAGFTSDLLTGFSDVCLLKIDYLGNEVWRRTFDWSFNDRAASISNTADGGFIVAGHTYTNVTDSYSFLVMKITASGDETWRRVYSFSEDDRAHSVRQTPDGGYIVSGKTWSAGAKDNMMLLKLDREGNIRE